MSTWSNDRWAAHVAASSRADFTFWVWQDDDGRWVATEVETGVSGKPSSTAQEALASYWTSARGQDA